MDIGFLIAVLIAAVTVSFSFRVFLEQLSALGLLKGHYRLGDILLYKEGNFTGHLVVMAQDLPHFPVVSVAPLNNVFPNIPADQQDFNVPVRVVVDTPDQNGVVAATSLKMAAIDFSGHMLLHARYLRKYPVVARLQDPTKIVGGMERALEAVNKKNSSDNTMSWISPRIKTWFSLLSKEVQYGNQYFNLLYDPIRPSILMIAFGALLIAMFSSEMAVTLGLLLVSVGAMVGYVVTYPTGKG